MTPHKKRTADRLNDAETKNGHLKISMSIAFVISKKAVELSKPELMIGIPTNAEER